MSSQSKMIKVSSIFAERKRGRESRRVREGERESKKKRVESPPRRIDAGLPRHPHHCPPGVGPFSVHAQDSEDSIFPPISRMSWLTSFGSMSSAGLTGPCVAPRVWRLVQASRMRWGQTGSAAINAAMASLDNSQNLQSVKVPKETSDDMQTTPVCE